MNQWLTVLLIALSIAPGLAWAEPAEPPEEQTQEEPVQEQKEIADTEAPENKPEPGNLRSREIGAAFRNFRPSEEISADNAVSFPVDI